MEGLARMYFEDRALEAQFAQTFYVLFSLHDDGNFLIALDQMCDESLKLPDLLRIIQRAHPMISLKIFLNYIIFQFAKLTGPKNPDKIQFFLMEVVHITNDTTRKRLSNCQACHLLPIYGRWQGHVKVITRLVIPAEAGIQKRRKILDSHFRGNDGNSTG